MGYLPDVNVIVLNGKTLSKLEVSEDRYSVTLETECGERYKFYHDQECCENVYVYDLQGQLKYLIGHRILDVTEKITDEWPEDVPEKVRDESATWTTFIFHTIAGNYTMRWLGTSNGCYGESVSFRELLPDEQ